MAAGKPMKMNWIRRKIHLYYVTVGLYGLDWWEQFLFNLLTIMLLWFLFRGASRSAMVVYSRYSMINIRGWREANFTRLDVFDATHRSNEAAPVNASSPVASEKVHEIRYRRQEEGEKESTGSSTDRDWCSSLQAANEELRRENSELRDRVSAIEARVNAVMKKIEALSTTVR